MNCNRGTVRRGHDAIIHTLILVITFGQWVTCPDAAGQTPLISLDKIFDQFSGVSGWVSLGTKPPRTEVRKTLGLELPMRYGFELSLGPYPPRETQDPFVDTLAKIQHDLILDSITSVSTFNNSKLARVREELQIRQSQWEQSKEPAWKVYVALGLDFSDGYRISAGPLQLKVPVRGWYLGTYAEVCRKNKVGVLVGAICGFYDLYNATGYVDSASHYELIGSTFSFELIPLDLSIDLNVLSLQLGLSYRYLAFEGVRYEGINSPTTLARGPDRIDLSGFHFSLGIELAKKK